MQMKRLVPKPVKTLLRKAVNAIIPSETIDASKKKWNELGSKNPRYYVLTDYGEKITEEKFKEAGKKDYRDLIENDGLLKERLSPFKEKTVLEIGCGIGRITFFIANHFKSVTGIDISESMIHEAKERLSNTTNATLVATDGLQYPFPENTFDFVFSFIVFQHMPDRKTIQSNIQEIGRVLNPRGIAKIQLRGLPTSKKNWFYGPSFTSKDLPSLLENSNLSVIKTEGVGSRYFWVWLSKN